MADINLSRPAAGASQNIPCAPDARFVFDFPTTDATMTRSGEDLVFSFVDGASVVLQDFYGTYNKDQLPSFAMEGVEVAAADFFAAMNQEDLMPAAGPASNSSVRANGHYNEYGDSALLSGLNRLGGEDVGWPGGGIPEHDLDGGGGLGRLEGEDTVPSVTVDEPRPDPVGPGALSAPSGRDGAIMADEGALANVGSRGHAAHGASGIGTFNVDLNGENGTVQIGGYTITIAGGNATVAGTAVSVQGVVITLAADAAKQNEDGTWTVTYRYALSEAQEHGGAGKTGADDALTGSVDIPCDG